MDEINAKLAKKYKNKAPEIKFASDLPPMEWLPTGILALDWINGGGGPRGRVEQLVGAKSSGKTSIALRRIAEAQRAGCQCCYIDVEHSMDLTWAKKMGVKLEELMVYTPEDYDSAETTLDVLIDILKTGDVDLVVLDAITSLCPQAKIDGDMTDKHYAGVAGVLSQFFDMIIGPGVLYNSNAVLILINQPRDVIGARFHMERLPGGKALAHQSSIITMVKEGDYIFDSRDKDANKIGKEVRLINQKNKLSIPYRESTASLFFTNGFNPLFDVLQFAEFYDLIDSSGAWATYDGEQMGQGRPQQAAWLLEHRDVYAKLKTEIRELILKDRGFH